jgi:transcriptional regulator with XRE-family HTH domain
MKRFADRLREARVAAGLTQEQLGFVLGVTKSSVSAWENGRETPSFRVLPQLRIALKQSLDELICGIPSSSRATNVRDESGSQYDADETTLAARDSKERALLLRYRALPAKRRAALLDLIVPSDS